METISQTHMYLVPLERSLNYPSIICGDKVTVFQRFINFSQSWGAAIIQDTAIKREITVVLEKRFADIYYLNIEPVINQGFSSLKDYSNISRYYYIKNTVL